MKSNTHTSLSSLSTELPVFPLAARSRVCCIRVDVSLAFGFSARTGACCIGVPHPVTSDMNRAGIRTSVTPPRIISGALCHRNIGACSITACRDWIRVQWGDTNVVDPVSLFQSSTVGFAQGCLHIYNKSLLVFLTSLKPQMPPRLRMIRCCYRRDVWVWDVVFCVVFLVLVLFLRSDTL